jgi:hypothetical protein
MTCSGRSAVDPLLLLVVFWFTVVSAGAAQALTGFAMSAADTLDSKPPEITLTHPLGGETFIGSTIEMLQFSVVEDCWDPLLNAVQLHILDGEDELLHTWYWPPYYNETFAYPWMVPETTTYSARMLVRAWDRYGWAAADTSGVFTILHSLTDAPAAKLFTRDGITTNYPNPFNPATTIQFSLRQPSDVELAVYNLHGQLVTTLAAGVWPAGRHAVTWHGDNAAGRPVASGVYLARLVVASPEGHESYLRRLTLLK